MKKALLIIAIVILVFTTGFLVYNIYNTHFNKEDEKNNNTPNNNTNEEVEEGEQNNNLPAPVLKVINVDSTSRPIAVMIDNEPDAQPHAGLQDAYVIYEMIIEGGQSRLLAFFLDKDTAMIGPVRSTRHYFLDYALEHNAILTHYGGSPKAFADIKTLGVNNISGTQGDNAAFWRELPKGSYHNVFTSIAKITERATTRKYNLTNDNSNPILNYSIENVDLSANDGVIAANKITVKYSKSHSVQYEYDETNQYYLRSYRGNPELDRVTKLQYHFKNIIVIKVANQSLGDPTNLARQTLDNVGSGSGYFMTNGYAIPITYTKETRTSKTIYKDLDGNEINVNDGNTIIHLEPSYYNVVIE